MTGFERLYIVFLLIPVGSMYAHFVFHGEVKFLLNGNPISGWLGVIFSIFLSFLGPNYYYTLLHNDGNSQFNLQSKKRLEDYRTALKRVKTSQPHNTPSRKQKNGLQNWKPSVIKFDC